MPGRLRTGTGHDGERRHRHDAHGRTQAGTPANGGGEAFPSSDSVRVRPSAAGGIPAIASDNEGRLFAYSTKARWIKPNGGLSSKLNVRSCIEMLRDSMLNHVRIRPLTIFSLRKMTAITTWIEETEYD
jgi:hypothetical protein